jgi:hypothetical protein
VAASVNLRGPRVCERCYRSWPCRCENAQPITRELAEQRLRITVGSWREPEPVEPPGVEGVERELQLHWLRTIPAYRELIRQRVAEAARRAESAARRIEREDEHYHAVDRLGREIEGCG